MTIDAPSLTEDNDALARDYDRVSATRQLEGGKQLVAELGLQKGERVLDVGCGTGLLAEHIAGLVGPEGQVLGIDPLPLRIELAQARARPGLRYQVGDAYALDGLPAEGFDAIVLNAVFHWLPEKSGPLRSFARLLRKGGRLAISTGLKGHRGRVYEAMGAAMAEPPFDRYARPAHALTMRVDADEMRALLEEAGFEPLLLEVRDSDQLHPSPEAAVRFSEASSFGNLFAHLPEEVRPAARKHLAERLGRLMTPQGLVNPRRRLIAVARRR